MTTLNACTSSLDTSTKSASDEDNRALKIKKLRAKLINEEHRLVLMKKIRQSQTRPINQQQQLQQQQQQQKQQHQKQQAGNLSSMNNNSAAAYMNNIGGIMGQSINPAKKLRPSPSSGSGSSTPLSLQRGLQSTSNDLLQNSLAMNQTPAHAHQRTKNNTLWNPPPQQIRQPTPAGLAPPHVGNLSRNPITTPPNVVQAMMGLNPGQQSLLMNQINALTGGAVASTNSSNRRSQLNLGNLSRQPITTSPNVIPGVSLPTQQQSLSNRRAHSGNLSRHPITTPPNVVQDVRSSLSGQQSLLMNASTPQSSRGRIQQQSQPTTTQQQQQQQSTFSKSQAAHVLLQKRTAAKNAIQKQLEQTLMQLPQKHIQLGIDFIPNANNIEFVYYIGLEACVNYLTNTKNPLDTEPLEKPFECSTCGTDFTPSWSWKRSNAVCENCVGNHVKRSIKNSQANRIQSILAKAAKQEQAMDKRIMAEAASVVSLPSTPTTSSNQRHSSLLQPSTPSSRSTSQTPSWPRANASPLSANRSSASLTNTTTTTPSASVPPALNVTNNLLAGLPPAALASLLQMNPQLNSLASLMTANTATAAPPNNTNNNTNQFAQVAALLMNQLTMNLWNKR